MITYRNIETHDSPGFLITGSGNNVRLHPIVRTRTADTILNPPEPNKAIALGRVWEGELKPRIDNLVEQLKPFVGFTPGNIVEPEDPGMMIQMGKTWIGDLIDALHAARLGPEEQEDADPDDLVDLSDVRDSIERTYGALCSRDAARVKRALTKLADAAGIALPAGGTPHGWKERGAALGRTTDSSDAYDEWFAHRRAAPSLTTDAHGRVIGDTPCGLTPRGLKGLIAAHAEAAKVQGFNLQPQHPGVNAEFAAFNAKNRQRGEEQRLAMLAWAQEAPL